MPRLGLGLGLNLPRPIFLGRAPSEPTGFVAKYTSYLVDNFTLVTGDSVNVWQDESVNSNDLTQATSANQPKLVEDFTVTQFTASNQPTLVDDAGTWKLDFDTGDSMEGLKPQSGDFTYVFKGINLPTDTGSSRVFLSNPSATNVLFYVVVSSDKFAIRDSTNTIHEFDKTFDYGVDQDVDLTRSGTLYSLYVDGVLEDSITVASVNQAFTSLGRENPSFNGSLQSLEIYDVAVADVTNITETPVQTLTADPLKMRTSANLNPTDGQDVAKWYADEFSAYRDARVVFDADDNMSGLPALTGDFTYVFKGIDVPDNNTGRFFLSDSSSASDFRIRSTNNMSLEFNDLSAIVSPPVTDYSFSNMILLREGDTYRVYFDGSLRWQITQAGKSFTINRLGDSGQSFGGSLQSLNVFDRALTQEEIEYYSYLRSETGDILLPPLLPS